MDLKDLKAYLKKKSPRADLPAPVEITAEVPGAARPTVERLIEMFGPCDIKVEVETVDMIEIEARYKKVIYAFNHYRARINKAETFFARLDVAPAVKEKHRPEYEDIKSKAETARAEIIRLEYEIPFGKYFTEIDECGYIKLLNGDTFKEIKLEIKAA